MGSVVAKLLWISPLRHFIQSQARNVMLKRAEKMLAGCAGSRLQERGMDYWNSEKDLLLNPSIQYPSYYLREYHGYPKGNLCWEAAFEAPVMSNVAAIRAQPNSPPEKAETELRKRYMEVISELIGSEQMNEFKDLLDVCCGIGNSTFSLVESFPGAKVKGLDLSAYFLAVAKHRITEQTDSIVEWIHAPMEETNLPDDSLDFISLIGSTHEIPKDVMPKALMELKRILRPGGWVSIIDVNPDSIRKMPSIAYALFKSTEPDMDDYLSLDLPDLIQQSGFSLVKEDNTSISRRVVTVAQK